MRNNTIITYIPFHSKDNKGKNAVDNTTKEIAKRKEKDIAVRIFVGCFSIVKVRIITELNKLI